MKSLLRCIFLLVNRSNFPTLSETDREVIFFFLKYDNAKLHHI